MLESGTLNFIMNNCAATLLTTSLMVGGGAPAGCGGAGGEAVCWGARKTLTGGH